MVLEKLKTEMYLLLIQKIYNQFGLKYSDLIITKSQKEGYGDFTSTVAFSLSKQLRKTPMEIAKQLEYDKVETESLKLRIEAVAPGFLNIHLQQGWKLIVIGELQKGFNEKDFTYIIGDNEAINSSLHREIDYMAFRTKWILDVMKDEEYHSPADINRGDYSPTPIEEALINQMINWLYLQKEKRADKKKVLEELQEIMDTFWRYHNSLFLRKLEEPQRSFVLGLFLAVNKVMEHLLSLFQSKNETYGL